MDFNLAEKLAIVKAIDRVILADDKIAKGEMVYLGQLMKLMNFDSDFVEEARKFSAKQAFLILDGLSEAKKHSLAIMLHEMAYADGELGREEVKILFSVFENAGIKIEDPGLPSEVFNISDVYFKSSRHIFHKRDEDISEKNSEKRAIKIEPNINGDKGVTVTTFKLGGFIPIWGNKVELTPKHMDIVELHSNRSLLKGYGEESHEDPEKRHSNYSLSIFHPNNEIEKIVLHKHHLKTDIEFLK